MSEESELIVRRFFVEVFNQGNLDAVEEIFASDHVLHDFFSPEEIRGTEGMRQYVSMYRTAFPDLELVLEDQFAPEDGVGERMVVTRFTARGTHTGYLNYIAPTRNQVAVSGIVINRVSTPIAESWANWDMLGMMQQLGVSDTLRVLSWNNFLPGDWTSSPPPDL